LNEDILIISALHFIQPHPAASVQGCTMCCVNCCAYFLVCSKYTIGEVKSCVTFMYAEIICVV